MILSIAKFIVGLTGWDISKVQRWVFWILVSLAGLIVLFIALQFRSCGKSDPVVTPEAVAKINAADEKARKEALRETVVENQTVVSTVDNRTTIANADQEQRDREIAARVEQLDKKVEEAKRQGRDVTGDDLHCWLSAAPETCK